jgi:uncharacterized protein
MYDDDAVFVPANPMGMEPEQALFSDFEPGIRTLPVGFQVAPRFQPLPVEIVFEKDVAVTLRDGVTIYVDVMRPAGSEKVPVIVAWSPYGKRAEIQCHLRHARYGPKQGFGPDEI